MMDELYCCQRAEDCLRRAASAPKGPEKHSWCVLAGAWIDLSQIARAARPLLIRRDLTQAATAPRPQA